MLCATHSPVLAAMPGATILEVGEWGLPATTWEELELVQHWQRLPRRARSATCGTCWTELSRLLQQRHEHRVRAVPVRPQLDGAGHRAGGSRGPAASSGAGVLERHVVAPASTASTTPAVSASTGEQVA